LPDESTAVVPDPALNDQPAISPLGRTGVAPVVALTTVE
jgi:hypothetical protein